MNIINKTIIIIFLIEHGGRAGCWAGRLSTL